MDYNVNLARSSSWKRKANGRRKKMVELCGAMLLNSPRAFG